MDNTSGLKFWKVLCWNVRGLNSDKKLNGIPFGIKSQRVDVILFAFRKLRENILTFSLSNIFVQMASTVLNFFILWGLLEGFSQCENHIFSVAP